MILRTLLLATATCLKAKLFVLFFFHVFSIVRNQVFFGLLSEVNAAMQT